MKVANVSCTTAKIQILTTVVKFVTDEKIIAYIDGGARGNPGPAGYGVRVENSDGIVVEELQGFIGIATNNVAEYCGLLAALNYLDKHKYRNVIIRSDSELLIKQMIGQFKVRHPRLQPLHKQAKELVAQLKHARFEQIPRKENFEADKLANAAMDAEERIKNDQNTNPLTELTSNVNKTILHRSLNEVLSIGVDIESINRIDKLLQQYGNRFLNRIFTEGEISYSLKRRFPAQHLASRFAAKEAAMKALGTGHSNGVLWRNIEVVRSIGKPRLCFHGGAAKQFDVIGAQSSMVTLSHSGDFALAQVLLIG